MSLVLPRRPLYAGRAINPNTLPGKERVEYWINPRRGSTLGTTLIPLGSGAPAPATISADTGGSLAQAFGLYLRIDTSGTLGVATFSVSINGGASYLPALTGLATGANVALTGLGLRVQFTGGTFTAGTHFYQASLSQIQEQSPHGRVLVSSTTPTARWLVNWNAINGRPTLISDGSNSKIFKDITSGGPAALGSGTAKSRSFYMLAKAGTTTPGGALALLNLSNTGNANSRWSFSLKNGTNNLWSDATADAGGGGSIVQGSSNSLDALYHIWAVVINGTTFTLYDKSNSVIFTGTQSVGAQTFDSFSLGAENPAGAAANAAPCELGDVIARSGADDAPTRLATLAWLHGRFPSAA